MTSGKNTFLSLRNTISILRSQRGCPWDRKQTVKTLKKYIAEESNELLDAMNSDNPSHMCEESGDLLFLLILLAEINEENGHFNMDDVVSGINKKMIRRHPHVFAGARAGGEEELNKQWQKIKSEEAVKKTN